MASLKPTAVSGKPGGNYPYPGWETFYHAQVMTPPEFDRLNLNICENLYAEGAAGVRMAHFQYREGVPVVAGISIAMYQYGPAAVRNALRGERPADVPQVEVAKIA